MSKPEFKKPADVHVKMPDTPLANWLDEPAPTVEPKAETPDDPWREFPEQYRSHVHLTAPPFDGVPVFLQGPNDEIVAGAWRLTRRFEPLRKVFAPCGVWCVYQRGSQRIPFEPIGWKPYVYPVIPARKRA